jgi:putrescine transport system ATP-binding protein
MTLADRMAVMNRGSLIQVGPPPEIYEQPNSRWIADFIGEVNLIEGRVLEGQGEGTLIASTAAGRLRAPAAAGAKPGDTTWLALRPEKVRLSREQPAGGEEDCVAGQVSTVAYLGDLSIYNVKLDSGFVMKAASANMTRLVARPIGPEDRVWLHWPPDAAVVLTK